MANLASVIARLANLQRVAAEEEEDTGPSSAEIVEEARADVARAAKRGGGPDVELSFKSFLGMLKEAGGDKYLPLSDDASEYISEVQWQYADAWLKDNDYDHLDGDAGYESLSQDVLEVFWELPVNIRWDFSDVMLRASAHEAGDDFNVTIEDMEMDDAVAAFYDTDLGKEVKAAGFSDRDVRQMIIENRHVNGDIFIGIIANIHDVVADYEIKSPISGTPILVAHNPYTGDAHYETGTGSYTANVTSGKDLLDRLDKGKYSVGSIFGSDEWTTE